MKTNNANGILNILKPTGMTSFDVVAFLRRLLKTKKIGHTGTLDPGAVGVLPICVGNATKAIEYLTEKDKLYRAELTLGITTDTQDSTGRVVDSRDVKVSEAEIRKAVLDFEGSYSQVPPMFSAVKVEGKRLYELARSGITIERKPRHVTIHSINIINIKDNRVLFDVACSKGTYIRTLCSDIGERLGCGGHMSFLIRLQSGIFNIDRAYTLEEVIEAYDNGSLMDLFVQVDEIFYDLNKIILNNTDERKLINGAAVKLDDQTAADGQQVRVYNKAGTFLALGEITMNKNELILRSKKLYAT